MVGVGLRLAHARCLLLEAQDLLRRYGGLIRRDCKQTLSKSLTNSSSSLLSLPSIMKLRIGLCAHETSVRNFAEAHLWKRGFKSPFHRPAASTFCRTAPWSVRRGGTSARTCGPDPLGRNSIPCLLAPS